MKPIGILAVVMLMASLFAVPFALAQSPTETTEVEYNADVNRDGFVDRADLQIVIHSWGSCIEDGKVFFDNTITRPLCNADINKDGEVNVEDLMLVLENWDPPSSDLNSDGVVDEKDLHILMDEWGKENSKADLNRDGTVDVRDLMILLKDWTRRDYIMGPSPIAFQDSDGAFPAEDVREMKPVTKPARLWENPVISAANHATDADAE